MELNGLCVGIKEKHRAREQEKTRELENKDRSLNKNPLSKVPKHTMKSAKRKKHETYEPKPIITNSMKQSLCQEMSEKL
jgi:hypothetical protein